VTTAQGRVRVFAAAGLVLASAILHALMLRLLPGIESRAVPVEVTAIRLEWQQPRAPAAQRGDNPVATSAPAHALRPLAPPSATAAAVRATSAPDEARPMSARPAPEQPAPAPAQSNAQPDVLDLAPRTAALSALPRATQSVASGEPRDDLVASRGAELSAELHAVANENPGRQHRTPDLVRDPDGTCHYAGDAVNATILPDGGVRFENKPSDVRAVTVQPLARGQLLPRGGPPVPPEHPVTPEEQIAPQQLEFRVKVTPRAWDAERAWFLRETEALRAEMADAAHERELGGAEHGLRKRLDHIWCDVTKTPEQRRRAIFEVWNETSVDEVGARGRRVVEAYVRENLPQGSALAFSPQELLVLNSTRGGRERFEPYARATADTDAREH
jgi:hypothetical protein